MSDAAPIDYAPSRYGMSDRRRPRWRFYTVDKDGKHSLVSARYEPVLLAVTAAQLTGWQRGNVLRERLPAHPWPVRVLDALRTVRIERRLSRDQRRCATSLVRARRATMSAS